MSTPRDPDHHAAAAAGPAPTAEPFVRLAELARQRGTARASSYEERTGALIRRAALPEGAPPERLGEVWERLEAGRAHRPPGPVLPLRWAIAGAVLLSAGAVAAGTGVWTWPRVMVRRLTSQPAPASVVPAAPADTRGRSRVPAGSSPLPPAPFATPAEAPPAPGAAPITAPAARRPRREPALTPAPVTPRDPALAEESASLGRALVRLRQARDPGGALAELDRYRARFPRGVLEREAQVARVDALLMASRPGEARAVLARLDLGASGRDRELRLIRAELATESDCRTALEDYQAVGSAGTGAGDPWSERALWGQAICHARLGDESQARADLTRYLTLFPGGPHATDARARLRN